jgi:hypothetical protein
MLSIARRTCSLPLAILTVFLGIALGQEYRGKVQGVVTDPSQASIVGAKVTLRNINTGTGAVKETDATGRYLFDFVLPGTYSLAVEAAGFHRFLQENITVLTRGDVTVDAQLSVGAVGETISVSADVAQVQFNTSTMTTTVQGNMLRDIPVLSRNPFTLAMLNPAVINQYWDVSHRYPFYMWAAGGLDIGGRTAGKNDLLLDGAPTGVGAKGTYMPSMDGVQEVAVQQNAVDAEFGFSAGGTLNVSMKSGTNDFHGTAYYFGRNPALNAVTNRTAFPHTVSVVKNHIWGGTVGGPVTIPKVINGKNKLFFYQVYEGWKNTVPNNQTSTAPTDLQRSGDFSNTFQKDGSLRLIYDPWTSQYDTATNTGSRMPFPDNILPKSRINATGQKIVNDMYSPLSSGDDITGVNNFRSVYPYAMTYWNTSTRVDYNISEKLRLFARYSRFHTQSDHPQWGNTIATPTQNEGASNAISPAADLLWVVGPRTTLNVRYSGAHAEDLYGSKWAKVPESVWANLWPNGWYKPLISSFSDLYYPNFNFYGNGSAGTGRSSWYEKYLHSQNVSLNVTHNLGKHDVKAGWMLRYQNDISSSPNPGGFNFNSVDTGNTWLSYDSSKSGDVYASTLLGILNGGTTNYAPAKNSRQQLWSFFVQDDIKVSRRVTLNVGLRYEFESAPSDAERIFSRYLDLTNPISEFSTPPQMPAEVTSIYKGTYKWNGAWVYTDDSHPGIFDPQKNVFLPRFGAAIRINDLTSLRVGFGRYSVPWVSLWPEADYWPTDGYSRSTSVLESLVGVPRATADDPFPASGQNPNPMLNPVGKSMGRYLNLGESPTFFPQNMIHPVNDRINVSLQRQLPFRIITDTTFFANLGRDVQDNSMWGGDYSYNLNMTDPNYSYTYKGQVDATTVANPFYNLLPADKMAGSLRTQKTVTVSRLLRPYPHYGSITERFLRDKDSRYYSLQFKAEKPMAKGLAFTFGYNYSREKRDEFYDDIATYNKQFTMIDTRIARHYVRLAGTYELPFGKGREFLSGANRFVDALVGGWATSHMFMWQNGPLLGIGNVLVSGNPNIDNPTRDRYFDTSKFAINPPYTPRTSPWYFDGLRGFGFWSWDATAVKYFPITERVKFELRMEFYNLPNSFMPSQPSMSVTSSQLGKSAGIAAGNYGREVQYAARIHF